MSYENSEMSQHPNESIRAYRSAPATTGADGVWMHAPFDATSALDAADGCSVVDGKILIERPFSACIMGKIGFDATAAPGLSKVRARLVIERGGDIVRVEHQHAAIDETEVSLYDLPALLEGDAIRVDVRGDGAADVPLLTGETVSFVIVRAV